MSFNFSDHIHKPEIIGPGYWSMIHSYGYTAIDEPSKRRFYDFMNYLAENFPCIKCRTHIVKYIDEHPMKDYWNITNSDGKQIGLFKWSWMMHNNVNAWLKKPLIDLETAYKLYDPKSDECKSCTMDDKKVQQYPPLSAFMTRVNSPRNHFNQDAIVPLYAEESDAREKTDLKITGK